MKFSHCILHSERSEECFIGFYTVFVCIFRKPSNAKFENENLSTQVRLVKQIKFSRNSTEVIGKLRLKKCRSFL